MTLFTIALLSFATVAAMLIMLLRIASWRTVLRYRAAVDIICTAFLFWAFAGTLGGALVAAIGGLSLSLMLSLAHAARRASKAL